MVIYTVVYHYLTDLFILINVFSPLLTGAPDGTLPNGYITCAWCQKPGIKLFTLRTSTTTKAFCSEVCFTQCRRASFKKNRVCDWCKHVRHTVNYVDFQDGEQQLQFCSAKCLNQYKMKIFCKETQEHLQQIQNQNDNMSASNSPDKQILITPDLWMKESPSSEGKSKDSNKTVEESDRDGQKEIQRDINSDSHRESRHESHRENHRDNHRESHRESHRETTRDSHRENITENHRETVRERHREEREKSRKPLIKPEWKSDLHQSSSHSETDKSRSAMNRLVRDRHRRSSSKDSISLTSSRVATATEPLPTAATPAQVNPMFANPGYPPMPWLPPQFWGSYGPGMPPMGPIPPWMYGGFMPPVHGVIPAGDMTGANGLLRPPSSRMSTPTRPALSPDSSSQSTIPNIASNKHSSASATPVGASSGRPSKAPGHASLPTGIPHASNVPSLMGFDPNLGGFMNGGIHNGGFPPVTMIMPIPFPLPVPFPVPLPLPLKMEQIMEVYNKKQLEKKTEEAKDGHTSPLAQGDKTESANYIIKSESDTSDNEHARKIGAASHPCISYSERASSVTSCPDLSDIRFSAHDLSIRKRPLTPRLDGSLDLTKRPRSEVNSSPDSYDGVIDLSMDSSMARYKMSPGKENRETNESDISQDGEEREVSNGELGLKIPRIHIITPRSEPPLNQQLPLPPRGA